MSTAVLSQGVGYGVVIGISVFFAAFMLGITWALGRYTDVSTGTAEEFSTASRSVKPGLLGSGIVSAWTWSATLLQSSTAAYTYGISGGFWYAAAGSVEIFLFAQNAARIKINAPYAHTFLEVIRRRWGTGAHLVFLAFALCTNLIVSTMLILGGAATVNSLTGCNTIAVCFLIPLGVCTLVAVSGFRGTLLADYTHTVVLLGCIVAFMLAVFTPISSNLIGSPRALYNMLEEITAVSPVEGNAQGSFLTMKSNGGIAFATITLSGGLGTVYLDQSYWQRAIASRPETAVKAYFIGGSAWFAIPFAFATTMGLACRVLMSSPSFPTYPLPISAAQVQAGLVAPFAVVTLLGKGGALAMLVLLFLAVTSAASAEIVAVASIMTYDIYVPYINPAASEAQLMRADLIGVGLFGLIMAVLSTILFYVGISLGWLYGLMGIALGSGVVPVALAIMSKRANKRGSIAGCIVGLVCGLVAWLITASKLSGGVISVVTTGTEFAQMAGGLSSLIIGGIVSLTSTYFYPDNFDWEITRSMNRPTSLKHSTAPSASTKESSGATTPVSKEGEDVDEEKKGATVAQVNLALVDSETAADEVRAREEAEAVVLMRVYKRAVIVSISITALIMIVVPLPLFFSSYVFDANGFTGWVAIAFIWIFYAIGAVGFYPVLESRKEIVKISKAIAHDLMMLGRRS